MYVNSQWLVPIMLKGVKLSFISIQDDLEKAYFLQSVRVYVLTFLLNKTATIDNLKHWGYAMTSRCVMCNANEATVAHFFATFPLCHGDLGIGFQCLLHRLADSWIRKEASKYSLSRFLILHAMS